MKTNQKNGSRYARVGVARWCAAAALTMALAATAEASVRVYGEATSTGPTISVQVYADITSPAIVSHSCKLFYPAALLQVTSATRNDAIWSFNDGTRSLPYAGPDTSTPGEVLFVGGHLDARDPLAGVTGNHVLLGTVAFNRLTPDAPNFDMSIGRTGQFASFVTVNGTILEAQAGQVTVQNVSNDPSDTDLDGLSDAWEEAQFGTTKGVFYSDDPDHDGANNQGEEAMGSDPNDPRSVLRLGIQNEKDKYLLEWSSAEGRTYTIEASRMLGRFEAIKEGITATPPRNTFEFDRSDLGEVFFFRLRVDPLPRR
jgi:hypothetical protein